MDIFIDFVKPYIYWHNFFSSGILEKDTLSVHLLYLKMQCKIHNGHSCRSQVMIPVQIPMPGYQAFPWNDGCDINVSLLSPP